MIWIHDNKTDVFEPLEENKDNKQSNAEEVNESIKRSVNEKQLEFVVSELETNQYKSHSFYLKHFIF